jgi:hypothetical protein
VEEKMRSFHKDDDPEQLLVGNSARDPEPFQGYCWTVFLSGAEFRPLELNECLWVIFLPEDVQTKFWT